MISYAHRFCFMLTCVLLAAENCCAAPPADWPQPSSDQFRDDECPKLAGIYNALADNYLVQLSNDNRNDRRKNTIATWIPRWHPRWNGKDDESVERTLALDIQPNLQKEQFAIVQTSQSQFEVRTLSKAGTLIQARIFDTTLGDYTCNTGVLTVRADQMNGYSDGVGSDTIVQLKIKMTVDGSILYHQRIESKSRSFFYSKKIEHR